MSFEARYALEASDTSTGISQQETSFGTGNGYRSNRARNLGKRRSTYADLLEASPENTLRVNSISNMLEESVESRPQFEPQSTTVEISRAIGSKIQEHHIVDLSQLPASSLTGMDTPPRNYSEDSDGIRINEGCTDQPKLHEMARAVKDSLAKGSYLTELLETESGAVAGGTFGVRSDISPEVSLSLNKSDSRCIETTLSAGSGFAGFNVNTLAKDNRPKPNMNSLNLPPSGRPSLNHPGSYLGQAHSSDMREPLVVPHQANGDSLPQTQLQKQPHSEQLDNSGNVDGKTDLLHAMEAYGITEDSNRTFKPYPRLSNLQNSTPLYNRIADQSERNRTYYSSVDMQVAVSTEHGDSREMFGGGLASILDHGVEIHPTQSQIGQVAQFLEGRGTTAPYGMLHEDLADITEEVSSPQSVGTPLVRPYNRPSSASMTHYPGHPINRTHTANDADTISLSGYQPLPELPSSLTQSINDYVFPRSYDYYSHPVYSQSPQNKPVANPFSPKDALADVYRITDINEDDTVQVPAHKSRRSRSAHKHAGKSPQTTRSRASSRNSHPSQGRVKGGATHALASSIISGIGTPYSSSGLRTSRAPSRKGEQSSYRRVSTTQISMGSSSTRLNASKDGKSLKKSVSSGKSSTKKRSGSQSSSRKSKSPSRKLATSKKIARSTSTMVAYASKQTSMISDSANSSLTEQEVEHTYAAPISSHKKYTKYELGQLKGMQDLTQTPNGLQSGSVGAIGFNYTPKNNDNWPLIPQQKMYARSAVGTAMGSDPMFPPRSANQPKQQLQDSASGTSGQHDGQPQQRPSSAGKTRGRSASRASSRSTGHSSFSGSRPSSANTRHSSEYPSSGKYGSQQHGPITMDSLVQKEAIISPRLGLISYMHSPAATQNDRLHDDLRNLIKQKLIGMNDQVNVDADRDQEELPASKAVAHNEKSSRTPVDLRQLKGVYSRNHEHIHDNVIVTAEGKRYKVVGYNQKV